MAALLLVALPAAAQQTTYEKGVQQASVQPGVQKVAYVLAGRLWLGDLSSGAGTLLETSGDRVAAPVLSPDGRTIVFVEWEQKYRLTTIKAMDAVPGSRPHEVFRTQEDLRDRVDVDFARGLVVFSIAGGGLRETKLTGGTPRPVTSNGSDRSPRYGPGGALAFVRAADGSQDLWVLEQGATKPRRVQSSVSAGEQFDWSPDGATFVLESHDTGNMELWTIAASGGAARRVTDNIAQEHGPVWATDGRVYFQKNRTLWSMQPDGSALQPIALRSRIANTPAAALFVRAARVLDVKSGVWRDGQDLLIENGTITRVAATGGLPVPHGAQVVDATGLWAIPGLVDAHTHYVPWMGTLMRRFGVTLMRDLGAKAGVDWILDERDQTLNGHIDGPAIVTAGPTFNGSDAGAIGQIRTNDVQLARDTMGWLADQGIDLVKVGSENNDVMLRALIETAHARKLPVWGHISLVSAQDAIAMGQDGIEHLRGIGWSSLRPTDRPQPVPRQLNGMRREAAAWWNAPDEGLRALASVMTSRRVGFDPTLTVMHQIATVGRALDSSVRASIPPRILALWARSISEGPMGAWGPEDSSAFSSAEKKQEQFVKLVHDGGGLITTGSDIGVEYVVPGLAIHEEMARLVALGLKPIDAVRAATLNGAVACRLDHVTGTLQEGKWGSLLLLDADPLVDIRNTRRIRWVIDRGVATKVDAAPARP